MALRVGHTRKRKTAGGAYLAALIFCCAVSLFGSSAFGQESLTAEQIVRMQTQAEADLATLFERIQTAETATKNAEQELIAQKQKLDAALSKVEEQRAALAENNTQQSTNQEVADKLTAEIAVSEALRRDLEQLQASSQKASLNSVSELKVSRETIESLRSKLNEEATKNKVVQDQLNEKLGELEQLKRTASISNQQELNKLLAEILTLKARLKKRDEFLQKLEELQAAQLIERDELMLLSSARKAKLVSTTAKLNLKSDQLTRLRKAFEENKAASALTLSQKIELEAQLLAERQKHVELQKSLDELSLELTKSKAVIRALEAEKVTLLATADDLRVKVSELETAKAELSVQSENLADQLALVNENKSELQLKYQALLEELKKINDGSQLNNLPPETLAYLNKPRELLAAASADLMFRSGSARLSKAGKMKIRALLPELEEKLSKLPADKDWVLVVEGHADKTPIRRSRYKSNLDLSVARAVSVVNEIKRRSGIDLKRVMAAGFGEYHPVKEGSTPEDLAANRRVELRLSER